MGIKETNKELTTRELEILVLMSTGLSSKQVAFTLKLSIRTVEARMLKIKWKLGATHGMHAMAEAFRRNIIK